MKKISGKVFTVKVSIEREQEDGLMKKVREEYCCQAVNFTDCEAKITKEVGSADNVKQSFDILAEAIAPFNDVYVYDNSDIFYKVKVHEPYTDDYGNEKKNSFYYLVNADSIDGARKNIEAIYAGTTIDFTIAAIIETKIKEVFE